MSIGNKTIMSIGNKLVFFAVASLIVGCSSLPENKRIITPNPTSYVFTCSKDTLRNAIISEFNEMKYRDMALYYEGSELIPLDSLDIFSQPENSEDFYLNTSFIWIGESYLYPELKYHASFHLHLLQVDEENTEVVINTINPRVILGKEILPSFPHFARGYRYHEVPPSTIEEYEILYRIGQALHQEMPKIIYPSN